MTYTVTLSNGNPLPTFIKYISGNRRFIIFTDNVNDRGKYEVLITGRIPPWMAVDSVKFNVTVKCIVTSVTPSKDFTTLYYSIRLNQMTINMPNLVENPECKAPYSFPNVWANS